MPALSRSLPSSIVHVQGQIKSGDPVATTLETAGNGPLTTEVVYIVEAITSTRQCKCLGESEV